MKLSVAQKYVAAIKKVKSKYVTLDSLSKEIGYYDSIIIRDLTEFEPLLAFDHEINIKDILPKIEEYINSINKEVKSAPKKKTSPTLKTGLNYQNFIYEKMTLPGGLIDRNRSLTESELKALKKLITSELKKLKETK